MTSQAATSPVASDDTLIDRYRDVRARTEALCETLEPEDMVVQSMADVSPAKWHLAHTSWFFETFVLARGDDYRCFDPAYEYLHNSYYNSVGAQFPRARRGLLTRPTVDEIRRYRAHVDASLIGGLERGLLDGAARGVIELGLHHEQQHQELLLMDIKHVLFQNPLYPAYRETPAREPTEAPAFAWIDCPGGIHSIGAEAGDGFAFDNEGPRHRVLLEPHRLANRLVTNAEYLEFIRDGGYRTPSLWLADGWALVQTERWNAPLYWVERDGEWFEFTLAGLVPLDPAAPVCHVSFYEADAYASWADARLPTEAEWEVAAAERPPRGRFLDPDRLHPAPASGPGLQQLYGDAWEWTRSAYQPYPGFRAAAGALGEYNGKFMCNQLVLRGGCCATPSGHLRASYRNFFYPHQRWMFSGIRLASDRGDRAA